MAEENKKEELKDGNPEGKKPEGEATPAPQKQGNLFDRLFYPGNKLLTVTGSDFAISNETRRLLALFSDGTYLVSKDNRFDGAVYNFEATVKRRKILINLLPMLL